MNKRESPGKYNLSLYMTDPAEISNGLVQTIELLHKFLTMSNV